ncbi:MAG TPA: transposase [Candidatus Acidoferrum sp.]|nr:transposase [Candidatus Acidoferrum sp.]
MRYKTFSYQAGSWTKPRRIVAKIEDHPGELFPRVGFIVTSLSLPSGAVVRFYNRCGTAEQRIKNWLLTRLQQQLVKTGGRLINNARDYRRLFGQKLRRIWALPVPRGEHSDCGCEIWGRGRRVGTVSEKLFAWQQAGLVRQAKRAAGTRLISRGPALW